MRKLPNALTTLVATALIMGLATAVSATPAGHQETDVLSFQGLEDAGDAHLVRTDNGLSTRARAAGLEPGVYTLWWVIWNAPENCATPFACVESDLVDPDVEVAIGFGGGRVVESSGVLNIAASLTVDEELIGFPTEFGLPLADAMADARHAEVHLVLRSHEAKIPGLLSEMLHSFNGGCIYEGPIAGSEPVYGAPGPNTCSDLYFAVFPSENAP